MTKTSTMQLPKLLVLLFAITFTVPSFALVSPSSMNAKDNVLANMKAEDFLKLTPKKYYELTGEKLSFTQKLSLKYTQRKVKRALKEYQASNINAAGNNAENNAVDKDKIAAMQSQFIDTSDFNIGGFILGLILPVIGLLIAYLIDDSSVIKWAWIGFGIALVFLLLFLIF